MYAPDPSRSFTKAKLDAEFSSSKFHDLQVCASLNSEDDVIYLRALCWASHIMYELAFIPGSEMAYVDIVLTYTNKNQICDRTIRTVSN